MIESDFSQFTVSPPLVYRSVHSLHASLGLSIQRANSFLVVSVPRHIHAGIHHFLHLHLVFREKTPGEFSGDMQEMMVVVAPAFFLAASSTFIFRFGGARRRADILCFLPFAVTVVLDAHTHKSLVWFIVWASLCRAQTRAAHPVFDPMERAPAALTGYTAVEHPALLAVASNTHSMEPVRNKKIWSSLDARCLHPGGVTDKLCMYL